MAGNVGNLRGCERETALSREFSRRPHEPRERLVIEKSREHVREQRLPSDFAVTDSLQECVTCVARSILQIGENLQRALGGESKIAMAREPRDRRIQVAAMDLERAFLEIGIANVGVNRGEPVQRPPFRRRDAHAPPCRAVASDFDVDLIFRWLGERHPELAAQRRSFRRGE